MVPGIGRSIDEIIKGYEVSKGNYILLDEDEIEAVKINKRTLELVQFVDACEIDPLFEKPYCRRRTNWRRKPSSCCAIAA